MNQLSGVQRRLFGEINHFFGEKPVSNLKSHEFSDPSTYYKKILLFIKYIIHCIIIKYIWKVMYNILFEFLIDASLL